MTTATKFDVLIVYNGSLARSASLNTAKNVTPFPAGSKQHACNSAYQYFLESCRRYGLSGALSTTSDVVGPGLCQSYWLIQNGHWTKHVGLCTSRMIFDKFAPNNRALKSARELLFAKRFVKPYNHPLHFNLFFDKQQIYDKLPDFAIPTVSVQTKSLSGVNRSISKLRQILKSHRGFAEFNETLILKDRHGAGGNHVYKVAPQAKPILALMRDNPTISFVLQPFVKFTQGFQFEGSTISTDIRFIFLKGKIVMTYIRRAKPGDFRCNSHYGGQVDYLTTRQIPSALLAKAKEIATKLNSRLTLFSLDFMVSDNNQIFLIEGNTGPGLTWDEHNSRDKSMTMRLINLVTKELATRKTSQTDPNHVRKAGISQYLPNQLSSRSALPLWG